MGKNTKGGSKHKKYARNRDESGRNDIKNLIKDGDDQTYAFISNTLGNCRFEVECWDKKKRLAHVRGKLKKRCWCNKGDLVLVSLRDFQDDKCDIIQKYSDEQRDVLIRKNEITESFAKDGKTFSNEYEDNISYESGSSSSSKNTSKAINVENLNDMEEINIDDI